MRAVVQRVSEARVTVAGEVVGAIAQGVLVLVGVRRGDTAGDAEWLADKVAGLRIFGDDGGLMNRSLSDVGGAVLAVSQFTLHGDCRRGRRPSFIEAMPGPEAEPLFTHFVARLRASGIPVATGRYGADMQVALVNDGPVTLIVDTPSPAPAG